MAFCRRIRVTRLWSSCAALLAIVALAGCGDDAATNPSDPAELQIEELAVGTGTTAAVGDTVRVGYTGSFLNGQVFDSSVGRTPPYIEFRLGVQAVIPGFEQGILGMRVGGRRRVTIPSRLAYGSQGSGSIPPNTPLRFEIELVAVTNR
jgi:FKBP-type peptidyl-prolyl cis-trans isomerase FkpA